MKKLYLSFLCVCLLAFPSHAATNSVTITTDDQHRTIKSNGIPDHAPGQFPNPGNPNAISAQDYTFRVPLHPQLTGFVAQKAHGTFGVAVNGVPFDPGTAEYYKNDPYSGWNYDALSGKINLGIDKNNAHVQPNGAYHYHGIPEALAHSGGLVGWAADGFPIYYFADLRSSWRLRKGIRPGGPRGMVDGTFVEDYEYAEGAGDLDECNGMTRATEEFPDGTYLYALTDTFPYVPRCWKGTPDESFIRRPRHGEERGGPGREREHRPPAEAVRACLGAPVGSHCRIDTPHGSVLGSCERILNVVACRPERR